LQIIFDLIKNCSFSSRQQ